MSFILIPRFFYSTQLESKTVIGESESFTHRADATEAIIFMIRKLQEVKKNQRYLKDIYLTALPTAKKSRKKLLVSHNAKISKSCFQPCESEPRLTGLQVERE